MLNGWGFSILSLSLVNTRVGKRMWLQMPFLGGILYFLFWKLSYLVFMLFKSNTEGIQIFRRFYKGGSREVLILSRGLLV